MRTDRPGPRTSTVPRLCSALTAAASGVVLCVAALAPACAQTAQPNQAVADDGDLFRLPAATTVFAPRKDKQDLRAPGRFRRAARPGLQGGDAPATFGPVQVYGNPPASGAGATGFDSTNAKRRKARDAVKQKPGVSLSLRPQPGVVPDLVPATVSTRPSAQDSRRGASAIDVPVQTLVPTIQTPTKRKTVVEEDPFAPTGIRAGAFTFFPAVELTGGLDTNPAHVQGGKDSFLFTVAPELKVRSDWERHALNADIKGSYLAYTQTFGTNDDGSPSGIPNSLDRPTLDSRVDGRIDVTSRSHFDLEGRLLIGTDNPGSPNIQAGLARLPLVTTVGTTLGYTQAFNRFELIAKGTFDRSVWQDSTLTDGTTSGNDDRNFDQYGGSLRVGYELKPGLKPFAEVGADTRIHDLTFDRNGEQRDSDGVYAKVGTTFEFTRKLTGEVSVGYLTRDYKDPALSGIGGLTTDASLVFAATSLTTFTATAKSTVNEVILPGVSGDFSRDFSLQVDHSLRRWLIATAQIGYGTDDYVGLDRFDQRWFASFQLLYKLSRDVQLKAQIRRDWIASSVPGVDYTADQFLLGVRLQR
jgi:hypothetical protein